MESFSSILYSAQGQLSHKFSRVCRTMSLFLIIPPFPPLTPIYELGAVESMQDLESDDLDLSHECDSFCMTLNKLSKFQEPSISRSVISHNRNDNSHFFFLQCSLWRLYWPTAWESGYYTNWKQKEVLTSEWQRPYSVVMSSFPPPPHWKTILQLRSAKQAGLRPLKPKTRQKAPRKHRCT